MACFWGQTGKRSSSLDEDVSRVGLEGLINDTELFIMGLASVNEMEVVVASWLML
jgi:hypothetical protein